MTETTTEFVELPLAPEANPLYGWIGGTVVNVHSIDAVEPVTVLTDGERAALPNRSTIHLRGGGQLRVNAGVGTIMQWRDQLIEAQRPTEPEADELDHSENDD